MFSKILVANRGEIAQRVFLACRELGIPSVAIYSEIDRDAPWMRFATESYPLAGVTSSETYLNQEAILNIASQCGADALHPGYGFLSENPSFAEACATVGVKFIGPGPEAMRIMGSKTAARQLAQRIDVPVIPGVDAAGKGADELMAVAAAIGYPLLVKASAGGGGRGMRLASAPGELPDLLQAARSEARSAFGDDHLFLEKFFPQVHHVEVQILGDSHGNILHLYERECSIQRRHQKIIEESPAPILHALEGGAELRHAIATAATSLARAANYVNAGTVEFLVDPSPGRANRFYFLEMNARLQVEHPVTELVTGIDMVTWQIRIAAGEPLPFDQESIVQRGHAIECRVYAEDPGNSFLPSIGKVVAYRAPTGPGIRVDSGIEAGTVVSPHYDAMLAKIIARGQDRSEALRKMARALRETVVLGVTSNLPLLQDILEQPSFVSGRAATTFLQDELADWTPAREFGEQEILAATAWEMLGGNGRTFTKRSEVASKVDTAGEPWDLVPGWRNVS